MQYSPLHRTIESATYVGRQSRGSATHIKSPVSDDHDYRTVAAGGAFAEGDPDRGRQVPAQAAAGKGEKAVGPGNRPPPVQLCQVRRRFFDQNGILRPHFTQGEKDLGGRQSAGRRRRWNGLTWSGLRHLTRTLGQQFGKCHQSKQRIAEETFSDGDTGRLLGIIRHMQQPRACRT